MNCSDALPANAAFLKYLKKKNIVDPNAPSATFVPITVLYPVIGQAQAANLRRRIKDMPAYIGAPAPQPAAHQLCAVTLVEPMPDTLPERDWLNSKLTPKTNYGLPQSMVTPFLEAQLQRYGHTLTAPVCLARGARPAIDNTTWQSKRTAVLGFIGFCFKMYDLKPQELALQLYLSGPALAAFFSYLRSRRNGVAVCVGVAVDVCQWFAAENPGCAPMVAPYVSQLEALRLQVRACTPVLERDAQKNLSNGRLEEVSKALVSRAYANQVLLWKALKEEGLEWLTANKMHDCFLESKMFLEAPPMRNAMHRMLRVPDASSICPDEDCPRRMACKGNRLKFSGRTLQYNVGGVIMTAPEVWGEIIVHHKNDRKGRWEASAFPYTPALSALASAWLHFGRPMVMGSQPNHDFVFHYTDLKPFSTCQQLLKFFRENFCPEDSLWLNTMHLRVIAVTEACDRAAESGSGVGAMPQFMGTSSRQFANHYDLNARHRERQAFVQVHQPATVASYLQRAGISTGTGSSQPPPPQPPSNADRNRKDVVDLTMWDTSDEENL